MNTTTSTATVKTTVLDALEQATEGRVDDEGFYRDGAFYLTLPDLAAEVQMNVPGADDLDPIALEARVYAVLVKAVARYLLDAAASDGGEIGWRLVVPENVSVHELLEDFEG